MDKANTGWSFTSPDRGETYAGISRKENPKWGGWSIIDNAKPLIFNEKIDDKFLDYLVKYFYESRK